MHNRTHPNVDQTECAWIESQVRAWIQEDGIDGVDDLSTGKPVYRDARQQRYFLGVRTSVGTHSRQRGVL